MMNRTVYHRMRFLLQSFFALRGFLPGRRKDIFPRLSPSPSKWLFSHQSKQPSKSHLSSFPSVRLAGLTPVASALMMLWLTACQSEKKGPDVSDIKVNVNIQRFEQAFFGLDTNNLQNSMLGLAQQYPDFFPFFTTQIMHHRRQQGLINRY
jgi:hypothetical protein